MTILETTDKENSEVNLNISKEDIQNLKDRKERLKRFRFT